MQDTYSHFECVFVIDLSKLFARAQNSWIKIKSEMTVRLIDWIMTTEYLKVFGRR